MQLTAYIHNSCPHSRELLSILESMNLTIHTEIIDVAEKPFLALRDGILSVPALFLDDRMIVSGTVDKEWLESYLRLFSNDLPDREAMFKNFISSTLDNAGTAIYVYLNEDYRAIFDNDEFLLTTSGLSRYIINDTCELLDTLEDSVEAFFKQFLKEKEHLLLKVIALNFMREIYWMKKDIYEFSYIETNYSSQAFAHWLFVRSAIGRIGLNNKIEYSRLEAKSAAVWEYIKTNFSDLVDVVLKTI